MFSLKLQSVPIPAALKMMIVNEGSVDCQAWQTDCGLRVLYSLDNTPKGFLKHVSVSRKDRYPHWDEILAVKEHFFGDIDAMMVMPKKKDYVNAHKNTFHVWETPTEWGIC